MERNPRPQGCSYSLCSPIKNPEEEDPPRRTCTRYFEGGALPPGFWLGNIVNRKPPRGRDFFPSKCRNVYRERKSPSVHESSSKHVFSEALYTFQRALLLSLRALLLSVRALLLSVGALLLSVRALLLSVRAHCVQMLLSGALLLTIACSPFFWVNDFFFWGWGHFFWV